MTGRRFAPDRTISPRSDGRRGTESMTFRVSIQSSVPGPRSPVPGLSLRNSYEEMVRVYSSSGTFLLRARRPPRPDGLILRGIPGFPRPAPGLEVTFKTPVAERAGWQWALISGASNLATILLGYLLLGFGKRIHQLDNSTLKVTLYYLTFLGLFLDPLNLSLGPLLYGGDANGIAFGLGIPRWIIQGVFALVFLLNHELVARVLVPAFGVETNHFLIRPWIGKVKRA